MTERDCMDVLKERIEATLWLPKATMRRIDNDDLAGRLDVHDLIFTSNAGFEYAAEKLERWSGEKYLVWGTDGLIGEVLLDKDDE